MKYIAFIVLLYHVSFSPSVYAAGPEKVATLDRNSWPIPIDSPAAFNHSSRYEIVRFAKIISQIDLSSEQKIKVFVARKTVNVDSVNAWFVRTQKQLLNNYRFAAMQCSSCKKVDDWNELIKVLDAEFEKPALKDWFKASGVFYQRYLYEQVRLAALFPVITSEIDKLDKSEINGSEFNDLEFLLSYDDGPSSNDRTKNLIGELNKNKISSVFFVLGENYERAKDKVDGLYDGQCLASHGYKHKSHQKWDGWKNSIDATAKLVQSENELLWFRPPYGQRSNEIIDHLNSNNSRVMLWNIDSQDWNRKLTSKQISDRVITLMLLWRKGILLFHDIHNKAITVLPDLVDFQKQSNYTWLNCQQIPIPTI